MGLIYGVILSAPDNRRIRRRISRFRSYQGVTNTLPLHIEILYNEYQFTLLRHSVMSVLRLRHCFENIIEWKAGYRSVKAG